MQNNFRSSLHTMYACVNFKHNLLLSPEHQFFDLNDSLTAQLECADVSDIGYTSSVLFATREDAVECAARHISPKFRVYRIGAPK